MAPPGAPERGVEAVLSAESTDLAVHRVPRERVRVRREVVTEEVTVVVAVRREVLRLEREPVADGAAAEAVQQSGDSALLEVVLSEERPVVTLEVVPYERVRVGVRSVPTTTAVTTATRREVADVTTEPSGAGGTHHPRSTP